MKKHLSIVLLIAILFCKSATATLTPLYESDTLTIPNLNNWYTYNVEHDDALDTYQYISGDGAIQIMCQSQKKTKAEINSYSVVVEMLKCYNSLMTDINDEYKNYFLYSDTCAGFSYYGQQEGQNIGEIAIFEPETILVISIYSISNNKSTVINLFNQIEDSIQYHGIDNGEYYVDTEGSLLKYKIPDLGMTITVDEAHFNVFTRKTPENSLSVSRYGLNYSFFQSLFTYPTIRMCLYPVLSGYSSSEITVKIIDDEYPGINNLKELTELEKQNFITKNAKSLRKSLLSPKATYLGDYETNATVYCLFQYSLDSGNYIHAITVINENLVRVYLDNNEKQIDSTCLDLLKIVLDGIEYDL